MKPSRPGRPGKGLTHLDNVAGTDLVRERVRLVLSTVFDGLTVREAAREIGISETHFAEVRHRILEGAVASAELRAPGRKPKLRPEAAGVSTEEAARLVRENVSAAILVERARAAASRRPASDQPSVADAAPSPLRKAAGKRGRPSKRR